MKLDGSQSEPTPTLGLVGPGDLWYKDAVVYSLNVETYQDSNDDGIGDFPGLTSRVDYLHALGITCIWLAPFYVSPNRDNRYDVADYYAIDSRLGSLGDFVDFLRVARERGIRVMIDLVANHTSDQHPWFVSAQSSVDSPYRDYYIWSERLPENSDEGMVFPGAETSTWSRSDETGAYYFHRFYRHQPDLNLGNPRVREEIRKIMGFWLELGVSGFRLDAAPFLIERKGVLSQNGEARRPHTFFRYMRGFLSWRRGDAALLAEANVAMDEVSEYVGTGDKLQLLFNFWWNQHFWLAMATRDARPLAQAIDELATLPPTCQWANFLRNHDELDLGRLSPPARRAAYDAFAPDANMRAYDRGIRRRMASMLGGDRARRELAHSLLLAMSGTPVLYYGDEIGMGDELSLREREGVRTPMQWSNAMNGGFSRAPEGELVRPLVRDGGFSPAHLNVAEQQRDPSSFLNWLQRAIGVRKKCRELSWGRTEALASNNASVLIVRCGWQNAVLVTVHNLSAEPQSVHLDSAFVQSGDERPIEMFSDREYEEWPGRGAPLFVAAYGYRWLRTASVSLLP
ncbi:MAG TPA: alpha-amylase family protein [Gemmatimonadaceae bacterium]|jgi:maltose alpha-D-glucosyltransferase/alpha-amylase